MSVRVYLAGMNVHGVMRMMRVGVMEDRRGGGRSRWTWREWDRLGVHGMLEGVRVGRVRGARRAHGHRGVDGHGLHWGVEGGGVHVAAVHVVRTVRGRREVHQIEGETELVRGFYQSML
jgi:hypothetical protein